MRSQILTSVNAALVGISFLPLTALTVAVANIFDAMEGLKLGISLDLNETKTKFKIVESDDCNRNR